MLNRGGKKRLLNDWLIGILGALVVFLLIMLFFVSDYKSRFFKQEEGITENSPIENVTNYLTYDTIQFPIREFNSVNSQFCLNEVSTRWAEWVKEGLYDERDFELCDVEEVYKLEEENSIYFQGYRFLVACSCAYYVNSS